MSIGIALEGCGARAAFHVGAVEVLTEAGVQPAVVGGASSGSMVASALALGRAGSFRARWETMLGSTDVFQPGRLLKGQWPMTMSDVLLDALELELGDMRLPELPLPIAIVVTHVGLGGRSRQVLTRADDVLVWEAIGASSFIPGPYAKPIKVRGKVGFDGAWEVRTPVDEVRALGANRVIAVVANPQRALIRGLLVERAIEPPPWARVLGPIEPLTLGMFDFDIERTQHAFETGRRSAEAFLVEHGTWLAGDDMDAPQQAVA